MNQADIDRQIKALDEAKQTILALWGRYQARDKLVDELENEIYKLKCSKSV
nr:MAG TPA: Not1 N-terminal domain, CCR4-Not complex component [Caudoviricetes sp.]